MLLGDPGVVSVKLNELTDGEVIVSCISLSVWGEMCLSIRVCYEVNFLSWEMLTGTWGSEGGGRYTSRGKKKTSWANRKSLSVQVSSEEGRVKGE